MDDLSRTLYDEIRRVAASRIRGDRALRSIGATDLAHEAIERVIRFGAADGVSRDELLVRVSRICRQVLVDRARSRSRLRRGGGRSRVQLELDAAVSSGPEPVDLVALDEAMSALEELDPTQVRIVEMRYFGGFTMPEVADALSVSVSKAEKDARKARSWLRVRMRESVDGGA